MKFFAPRFAGIALLAAQVSANGVCYDPDHTAVGGAMTAESVIEDLKVIKTRGFDSVRTYISKFGNTNLGLLIASANLTVALGVPYPQSDYVTQLEAAVTAANAGGVEYIFVGNENLAGATSVPSELISIILKIKSLVSATVKVGTVQRNTEVINYSGISGWSELVDACDVLGVNIHPYFTPGTTADSAIDVVKNQWAIMVKNFGDKLLVTETGWPSDGTLSGSIGSIAGLQTFFDDYKSWSSSMDESYYFQMFDTPYKTNPFEKTYGLCTSDATVKIDIPLVSDVVDAVSDVVSDVVGVVSGAVGAASGSPVVSGVAGAASGAPVPANVVGGVPVVSNVVRTVSSLLG
ncbi:hypothetical protein JG687_00018720 [Phytophthora cactorum]|uniref:glucan endo-1,3-beta-D-glucosidase n=1 Tax=Phytophthora cactorum TaxID=29920 RepID=A0A8T1TL16_9STRA|nr:hypothetical protein JG687_00018720 [Phytophthora cactorum]